MQEGDTETCTLASNIPSAAGDQTEQLAGYFDLFFFHIHDIYLLLDTTVPAPKAKFIWGFVYEDVVERPFQGLQRWLRG